MQPSSTVRLAGSFASGIVTMYYNQKRITCGMVPLCSPCMNQSKDVLMTTMEEMSIQTQHLPVFYHLQPHIALIESSSTAISFSEMPKVPQIEFNCAYSGVRRGFYFKEGWREYLYFLTQTANCKPSEHRSPLETLDLLCSYEYGVLQYLSSIDR